MPQPNLLGPWTIHDLRRTTASGLGKLGASRFIISRVLNHADSSVTGIYDRHAYLDEKRYALSTVFFLAPGRYDLALDHGVFTSDKFLRNEKIMSVIDAVFPFNGFMSYAGSLPSSPGSDAGEWHRDFPGRARQACCAC
jgi:hypothetical protein